MKFTNGAIEITTYQYDERSRLKEVVYTDGSFVRYGYDAAGNRTELTTPSATVNYTFDTLNRLHTVIAPEGTTTYGHDAVGNRASETKPNGVVTSYRYNPRNQLTWMAHKAAAGALLLGLSYTLDASGMRMKIEEFGGASEAAASLQTTRAYVYDPLMRLTEEAVTCGTGYALCAPRTTNWTYDQVGNRQTQVHQHGGGVATTTYRYDANDRLLDYALSGQPKPEEFVGVTTNRYDANGSLIETIEPATAGTTKKTVYGWDSENHLIAASIAQTVEGVQSTKEIRYTYNADGIRRTQTVGLGEPGAETVVYLVDPNQAHAQVIEETKLVALGSVVRSQRYSLGHDLIAANDVGASFASYFHFDGIGSTRLPSSRDGSISDQYGYQAFGEADLAARSGQSSTSNLFTGEAFDEAIDAYYLRARYYDADRGSLLSSDSFPGRVHSPLSLNKYSYVEASPVSFADPSGMFKYSPFSPDFGRQVEKEVCDQYMAAHLSGPAVECGKVQYYDYDNYWKPDIMDFGRFTFNEIKPLSPSGVPKGVFQIALYIAAYGPLGFSPEVEWEPLPIVVDGRPVAFMNTEGVIFYTDNTASIPVLQPVPLTLLEKSLKGQLTKRDTMIGFDATVAAVVTVATVQITRAIMAQMAATTVMARLL